MIATTVVGVCWGGFLLWYLLTYNHLIAVQKTVPQTWAHVDVELQRRYDLIRNLVEVVKAYAKHEADVLLATTQARAATPDHGYGNAKAANHATHSDTALLGKVMLLVEQYPQLKADQQFLSLQKELVETENRIAKRRNAYNECVSRYEIFRTTFPALIVAWAGHFGEHIFFESQDEALQAVQVKLS